MISYHYMTNICTFPIDRILMDMSATKCGRFILKIFFCSSDLAHLSHHLIQIFRYSSLTAVLHGAGIWVHIPAPWSIWVQIKGIPPKPENIRY